MNIPAVVAEHGLGLPVKAGAPVVIEMRGDLAEQAKQIGAEIGTGFRAVGYREAREDVKT